MTNQALHEIYIYAIAATAFAVAALLTWDVLY
jgi:hypothetical protein